MVTWRVGLLVLPAALWLGCSPLSAADARALEDVRIGIVETAAYRFEAKDGLLHVRETTNDSVVARASAAEFSFTLTRRAADVTSVDVRLWNLPASFALVADAGVLSDDGAPSAGEPDDAYPLGRRWTVRFPEGVDTVAVHAPPRPLQPFSFIAFGDIQGGIDRFHEIVDRVNQEPDVDFILMLGDLTQSSRPEQFDRVEAEYARLRVPLYPTPGNHDVNVPGEYQRRFGRASYSFTHKGARFTSVDSGSAALGADVFDWYRDWTEAGKDTFHVTFSHIPALEVLGLRSGQWNSRRQAHAFIARSVQTDVDLLLFGHLHTYDKYELGGIPTRISGGCGAIEEQLDDIGRHYLRIGVETAAQMLTNDVVRVDP